MEHKVGQIHTCPLCGNPRAKIVWKGKHGKVIGVKCQRSHEHKKDSVVLIEME